MKTLKELAAEALDIQNACNLCGLAQRFAQVQIELGQYTDGTDARNTHPVTRLWLDKMNSLARIQPIHTEAYDRVDEAYGWATDLIKQP